MTARLQIRNPTPATLLPVPPTPGVSSSGVGFELLGTGCPGRESLESEIRQCYAHHFGATVEGFMPWLLRVTLRGDGTRGVIGLRPAVREALYLEDYLEGSIEDAISGLVGRTVARSAVVEIGQLAVQHRRVVVPLFRELVPLLLQQGFDWVCFTATGPVRALLARAGLAGCEVTAASADKVAGRGDQWGDYYRHDPRVIVGDLRRPRGFMAPAARTAEYPA